MAKQMSDLEVALATHKAKLDTIEAISKTTTEPMQQILALDLQIFDRRLDSWATAAPLHKIISIYDGHVKPPY